MSGEVAVVGGGSVGAIKNRKKVGQQVNQHLDQSAGRRRDGTKDAEMIVVPRRWNKSDDREGKRGRVRRTAVARSGNTSPYVVSGTRSGLGTLLPFRPNSSTLHMVGDAP
jgi:hypothetical protein